jgi:hypothetical protein
MAAQGVSFRLAVELLQQESPSLSVLAQSSPLSQGAGPVSKSSTRKLPLLASPEVSDAELRGRRPSWRPNQSRGCLPARGTLPLRRPRPPYRPHPGSPLPPAHHRRRKTPQLRTLHDRRRPADQDRNLRALERPLCTARHRRHPDHRTTRPPNHQRPLPHPRDHPSQPPTTGNHHPPTPTQRAGHDRSRHALRSTARSSTSMNLSWSPHNT